MEAKSNETGVLSNAERQARFKANKAFKSLPVDVQQKILAISDTDEDIHRRTSIALAYQGMTRLANRPMPINLELCRTCGEPLPPLEQPRQHSGMCLPCVMKGVSHDNRPDSNKVEQGRTSRAGPSTEA